MNQRTPTMRELFNVYARLWLGTKLIVRLIHEARLTNIFPANLVRSERLDCQHLAVALSTPSGIQHAIFQKVGSAEDWLCLNMSMREPYLSTENLVEYAQTMAKYLSPQFQTPTPTLKAAWEIYHTNYPALDGLAKPITSSPEINIYPLAFNNPSSNDQVDMILELANGDSFIVRPQNGAFCVFLPEETEMSLDELRVFALS